MTKPIAVGDITVHRVVEQEAPMFGAFDFFPTLTEEMLAANRSWLDPRYVTGNKLVLCVQSYILRTPQHTIMIDACVGNHKSRPALPFWHMMQSDRYEKALAAAGFSVGDIDYVMCLSLIHISEPTRPY